MVQLDDVVVVHVFVDSEEIGWTTAAYTLLHTHSLLHTHTHEHLAKCTMHAGCREVQASRG